MKRSSKRARTAGAVAVEFAIIGLVFISLLLLAVDAGWQLVVDAALGAGGRAASRFGTTGATAPAGMTPAPTSRTDSITQIVIQTSGGLLQPAQLQFTARSYANFADAIAGVRGTDGPGNAGQIVQYTFIYTQAYLTPIAIAIAGSQMVHTLTVTVVNEPFPSA
jgi:Flp pilus assembly protein TadG